MSKLKYAHTERVIIPAKQLRAEWTAKNNRRKRPHRESWETIRALWELQKLYRLCRGVTTGAWPSYWEILQGSKPMPQGGKHLLSSNWFPKNYPEHKAYVEVASTQDHFLYNKQERDCIKKAEKSWELSGHCRSSMGLERPVSTNVYITLYLQRVDALAYLQGHCSVFPDTLPEPILALNKGSKQINRALVYAPSLPTWSHVAQNFSDPDSLGTHLAPNGLPKPPGTHKLQRDCFYIRPHFQDWERELLCSIHTNKQKIKQNEDR